MENIYDFQVGDKVWSPLFGFKFITKIDNRGTYPVEVANEYTFMLNGSYYEEHDNTLSLFHADAITLDDQGRLLSVDYNYRPKREGVKKEHQFKPKDWVLTRDTNKSDWCLSIFSHYVTSKAYPYHCMATAYSQCILYEGNEHLLGTTDNP